MNLKKSVIHSSILLAMGGVSMSANAALLGSTTAVLDFTGEFSMSTKQGPVLTPVQSGLDGGILIGQTQPAQANHASHGGLNHPNKGRLDAEWSFFSSAGQSFTKSDVVVTNDAVGGNPRVKELDFSGWRVTWNGIPEINMGGGLQDCGTTSDGTCGPGVGGIFDNGTGLATITCSTDSCSTSSTFSLSYNAVVPQGDPSGFGGAQYGFEISGDIKPHAAVVPVPAAVWLFGSGLVGLVGVARRKKAKV